MKIGLRNNMKTKGGLVTPKKYIKTVKRRQVAKSLLKGVERDIKATTVLTGYVLAGKFGRAPTGVLVGWYVALEIERAAKKKGTKLDFKTVAEISGRPKLAHKVADRLALKDERIERLIRAWGRNGPKMNARERELFVSENRKNILDSVDPAFTAEYKKKVDEWKRTGVG